MREGNKSLQQFIQINCSFSGSARLQCENNKLAVCKIVLALSLVGLQYERWPHILLKSFLLDG